MILFTEISSTKAPIVATRKVLEMTDELLSATKDTSLDPDSGL